MAIIWQPFQIYVLKVDGAGRTIMILSILAIVLNIFEFWKQKKTFTSLAFICWTVLFCYSMWNAFTKGFYAEYGNFKFLRDKFFDSFKNNLLSYSLYIFSNDSHKLYIL